MGYDSRPRQMAQNTYKDFNTSPSGQSYFGLGRAPAITGGVRYLKRMVGVPRPLYENDPVVAMAHCILSATYDGVVFILSINTLPDKRTPK